MAIRLVTCIFWFPRTKLLGECRGFTEKCYAYTTLHSYVCNGIISKEIYMIKSYFTAKYSEQRLGLQEVLAGILMLTDHRPS